MPTTTLTQAPPSPAASSASPLPQLLHTPGGLAILELQGKLNFPPPGETQSHTEIGRIEFPGLDEGAAAAAAAAVGGQNEGAAPGAWQKRVYLYVGANQRLKGEVKPLKKALGVLKRGDGDEVHIVDVVRWKIVFSGRPEFV